MSGLNLIPNASGEVFAVDRGGKKVGPLVPWGSGWRTTGRYQQVWFKSGRWVHAAPGPDRDDLVGPWSDEVATRPNTQTEQERP